MFMYKDRLIITLVVISVISILLTSTYDGELNFKKMYSNIKNIQPRNESSVKNNYSSSSQIDLSNLYQQYKMKPLDKGVLDIANVGNGLEKLNKVPCDEQSLLMVSRTLNNSSFIKEAIILLRRFADTCPNSVGELIEAGNISYNISEFQEALDLADKALHELPSANLATFLRARALKKLGRPEEALRSYADFIRTYGNESKIGAQIFSDIAQLYASIGKFCEAASSIQTYLGFDRLQRTSEAFEKEIDNYENIGKCKGRYAKGNEELLVIDDDSIVARVTINGIKGNFLVDTGASFVSVTPNFAQKANLKSAFSNKFTAQTANGITEVGLTIIEKIGLGRLSAAEVPAFIMEKPLQNGIDGLLGLSFLSRFNIKTRGKTMIISNTTSFDPLDQDNTLH